MFSGAYHYINQRLNLEVSAGDVKVKYFATFFVPPSKISQK
jgi:hypothetical protein